MKRVKWYSQKSTIYSGDIVAATAAGIVPMHMKMFLNLKERNYSMSVKSNSNPEKLKALRPSGKTDDSIFDLIYDIARQIPRGRVTSYGAIAKTIGSGKSARLVGWAMSGAGRVKPKVPAHRVVNSAGLLSGKHAFKTPTYMQELLEKEGIKIKNDKVVDFKTRFWDPVSELG